ncbi:MAG: hypothetical protein ACRDVG_06385, partial [Jatrophihabitantaceae bacterium]
VVPGGHGSTSSPAGATVTTTRLFAPYDRGGVPTAGVVAHRSGSCFTTSITVPAATAYRCFAGNSILDPCFVAPSSRHTLDCYAQPWSRAVRLQVTAALPEPVDSLTITRPWALELVGGLRCVATNGTPTVLRGIAMTYRCADGAAGLLRTSGATLLARYAATDGAVRDLAVTTVWRTATS